MLGPSVKKLEVSNRPEWPWQFSIAWAEVGGASDRGEIRCVRLPDGSGWMVWLGFLCEAVGDEFPADHPQGDGGLGPEK